MWAHERSTSLPDSIPSPHVTAVMPCLNEERTVGACIKKAQKAFARLGVIGEVVIADNGSTDNSVAIAQSLGARVIHQPVKGYGAALQAGIDAARGDIIIMGDCDDSYDWSAIGPFIKKIEGGYDFVVGNRFKGGIEPGAMPPLHRYLGNPVLSFISRVVFKVPAGDFHCGMRAFTKQAYERMRPCTPGMEFATELLAAAAGTGLRVVEIATKLYPDKRNRPPHLRSFRDGWRHLRFIVTYAPDYLFLAPGGIMLIFGLLLQSALAMGPVHIGDLYLGIHFLALAQGLSLMGFNVSAMGILAKVLISARYPVVLGPSLSKFLQHFCLESGLAIGCGLFLIGFAGAATILGIWLQRLGQSMTETVHPAFIAIYLMVLGANICFCSFLLHLTLQEKSTKTAARA